MRNPLLMISTSNTPSQPVSQRKGDLLAVVEVKTPTDLSPRQRKLLEELAELEAQRKPTSEVQGGSFHGGPRGHHQSRARRI
ncbi:hypothetical protein [Candidatus Nitrospira bockiana]